MFAVPGWSVSAANLKSEGGVKNGQDGSDKAAGSNKRKRPAAPPANNVNIGNVATLWERVIEGKSGKKPKLDGEAKKPRVRNKKKKQQQSGDDDVSTAVDGGDAEEDLPKKDVAGKKQQASDESKPVLETETASNEAAGAANESKKERKKKNKKAKGDQPADAPKEQSSAVSIEPTAKKVEAIKQTSTAPPPPATPKLTPLQASMREKLISARFRHLNETLYTRPSAEAFDLFQESPEMFQEYHEGFRRQVNVWPENPVDGYIKDIKLRGRLRPGANKDRSQSAGPAPLLRTNGVCTIADLGCGDAKLAESLQADKKKLKLEILSYDLQSPSPLVTRADIANLPLEDGSVNTVIFCLALMGTNWPAFVDEAYRVLHWKGELWIAEIKSRFTVLGSSKKGKPVVHSVGNRKKNLPAGKKGGKDSAEEEAAVEEALAVEVDGAEAKKQETDVSAFVEALRRRGFLLQTQDSVDLSNKMFVKMHFVKAAAATVGKNAEEVKEAPARGGGARKGGLKFIDAAKAIPVDESSILKPCVYKLR